MAKVVPFEGLHYNTERFGRDLTRFVAPPYDVIDPPMEKKLKADMLNITHITLGNESDAYTVASRRLQRWLDDCVLVRDQGQSYYIYEQTFSGPDGNPRVRSGVIGLVKLEDFSKGIVLPHEKTIPRHMADRLELIGAVEGNVEQIFLLYDDPSEQIESIILETRKREEILRFVDPEGVHHRILRISDPETVERISGVFGQVKLLIADGHHRYETSLEFRDRMRAKDGSEEGSMPYDYILATLITFRNPGLVVYPTHRLVQRVDEGKLEKLPKALEHDFDLKQLKGPEELAKAVDASDKKAFGMWIPSSGTLILATPKGQGPPRNPVEDLPVWIVQERVLKKLLGYTAEMVDTKVDIEYVKGTETTKVAMATGEYQACFFVKPPTVQQVMTVAETGQKMPHKSTYFFPKIWSGTLLYLFRTA